MSRKRKRPGASLTSKLPRGLLFSGLVSIFLMISLVLTGCAGAAAITDVAVSGVVREAATITWTTSGNATSQVEYGTTTAYGSETEVTTTVVTAHDVDLTGLTAGTTYYYRAVSGAAVSDGGSFTTPGTLAVYGVAVSGVTDVSATVTWTTTSNGDSQVEYGTTTSYGSTTTLSTTLTSAHSESVTGLSAGTTYHYRVKSSGGMSADGTFTTTASIAAITALWEDGDHNNVAFGATPGTNTYCARCHSPLNWDPEAMRGGPVPGSCFNCKLGPMWRQTALGNVAVIEDDFEPIGCSTCHDGGTGPDVALWNNGTMGYDAVATNGELCESCHGDGYGGDYAISSAEDGGWADSGTADTGGGATTLIDADQDFETTVEVGMEIYNSTDNSLAEVVAVVDDETITTTALVARPSDHVESDLTWAEGDKYYIYEGPLIPGSAFDGTGRAIVVRGSAHANGIGTLAVDMAPEYCSDCHNPHSLEADCTDCHTDLPAAVGHIASMAQVTCVACHNGDPELDGLGWDDLDEDEVLGSAGDLFRPGSLVVPPGPPGPAEFTPANTHWIDRTALNCNDCHYTDNEWGLSVKDDVSL